MKPNIATFAIVVAALSASVSSAATPPKAKITPKQAEASALKKIPGQVVNTKYEFEDGRWQYAVTVKASTGKLFEAEVSSTTGKVLDTEATTAEAEAKEAAADAKKAGK